eukprot:5351150-Alexandrium_andersonii.AAC.1
MPIILRDAEAEIRWCQNCFVCGKYHVADKCPRLREMPRRLAYEGSPKECTWAIPCPACEGNHEVPKCEQYLQLVELKEAPLICEWCGGG